MEKTPTYLGLGSWDDTLMMMMMNMIEIQKGDESRAHHFDSRI